MRQAGVLDVGCHSALLMVARRRPGTGLEPVFSHKVRLRLHETLDRKGRLDEAGMRSVERAVAQAVAADPRLRGSEVFAFATSVIRDAPNRDEVISRVARATGTRLRVVPGEEEARLAYLAARQWAGPLDRRPLLMLDIGGGTVEIASGTADQPGERVLAAAGRAADHPGPAARRHGDPRPSGRGPPPPGPGPESRSRPAAGRAGRTGAGLLQDLRATRPARLRAQQDTESRTAVGPAPGTRGDLPPGRYGTGPPGAAARNLPAPRRAVTWQEPWSPRRSWKPAGRGVVEICPWSTREGLLLERLGVPGTAAHRPRLAG